MKDVKISQDNFRKNSTGECAFPRLEPYRYNVIIIEMNNINLSQARCHLLFGKSKNRIQHLCSFVLGISRANLVCVKVILCLKLATFFCYSSALIVFLRPIDRVH